jgi:hypothetical protein
MRQLISGLVAAVTVATVSVAPAMACGGLFTGHTQCHTYVSPCGGGGGCNSGYHHGGHFGAYAWDHYAHERLPDPSPQYYHVNQGPTYSGPGNFAPYPTYQESAVSGWGAFHNTDAYYGYDGGRYANATNHYYDGATVQGPAIYSYGPRSHRRWRARTNYGVSVMPGMRYGNASRPSMRYGYSSHRSMRYGAMHGMRYRGQHVLRSLNAIAPHAARPAKPAKAEPSKTH